MRARSQLSALSSARAARHGSLTAAGRAGSAADSGTELPVAVLIRRVRAGAPGRLIRDQLDRGGSLTSLQLPFSSRPPPWRGGNPHQARCGGCRSEPPGSAGARASSPRQRRESDRPRCSRRRAGCPKIGNLLRGGKKLYRTASISSETCQNYYVSGIHGAKHPSTRRELSAVRSLAPQAPVAMGQCCSVGGTYTPPIPVPDGHYDVRLGFCKPGCARVTLQSRSLS